MKCPECGSLGSRVYVTNEGARGTNRRRACRVCAEVFSTVEVVRTDYDQTVRDAKAGLGFSRRVEALRAALAAKQRKLRTSQIEVARLRRQIADPEGHEAALVRQKKRREAKGEAAETGEPVQTIYERWGVA